MKVAALASSLALVLSACGGGGNTKSDPPPPTGTGIGFTPTVANDTALASVNPPTIPTQGAPATLPQYSQHLQLTNAAGALGAGLQGQGVTIGLLDTGVNRNHPALSGRVTRSFINVSSSANNTSVDDVVGHGTIVAQMAAGKGINNWGGGVAQQANIVSSRIISDTPPVDDGSGEGNEIGAGQGYGDYFKSLNAELANAGARIINNSWGGLYWNDPALTTELASAWKDFVLVRGGIIVFANGNSGEDPVLRQNPSDNAALPSLAHDIALERGWLAVAALDPENPTRLTDYSQACGIAMNYCLAAPGDVIFLDPKAKVGDASYSLWQGGGTSFAAPQVAGAAAVVWSAFPYFNNDLVRQTILGAAKDLGDPGVDPVFGWGLLDVSKAANGPSNFAWGDVSVSLTGNSVWRNPIIGSGGLVKAGSGTLTLAEAASYTGDTRVAAGGLDVRKGLKSNLTISGGATVWASGIFGGNVANGGQFLNGASTPASIAGNFSQTFSGNLGVWLGSRLNVTGTATLNGQMSILGVKSGYTTTSKETLLNAAGGVSGTFASLKAAPNVFLDAALAYDPNNVFLTINRIDVSKAVAGMGLSGIIAMSAARVEEAMRAIDGQLAGGPSAGIGTGFIAGAGELQQIASVAQADRSLRSLSGELHATTDAVTFDTIAASRRALSSRFGELAARPQLQGEWFAALDEPGQGGAASGNFQVDGWQLGSDTRIGAHVAGFAFGETLTNGVSGGGRDRSHDRQAYAQFYVGAVQDRAYALGVFGAGRYERLMHRELLLGQHYAGVVSQYAGDFVSASFEGGYRYGDDAFALTPYLGVEYVQLERAGFHEEGANGFGLVTNAGRAERTQAVAGLRGERAWTSAGGHELALQAHVEWQQSLGESGLVADARFVGAGAWSPLLGDGFARSSGLFGVGLDSRLTRHGGLSFGYDRRFGSPLGGSQWSLKLRYGF